MNLENIDIIGMITPFTHKNNIKRACITQTLVFPGIKVTGSAVNIRRPQTRS